MTTPDLTSYHAVHAAIRGGARRFADAVETAPTADRRRQRAIVRYWKGFEGELHAHHTIEDDYFFPALAVRVSGAEQMLRRTDADHARLTELMEHCTAGAAALAAGAPDAFELLAGPARELSQLMDAHLAFEDAEMLPLFAQHFTTDEYVALETQAFESIGAGPQAAFPVPFVLSQLDGATRAQMLATAPRPFRVIYKLFRGRYARLEQLALNTPSAHLASVH